MIGIFDSGVGGLGIFDEVRKLMPNEQILYLADTKNCPYGEKSEEEIKQICQKNAKFLIEKGADVVVVACNTASTIALEFIRSELDKMTSNNHIPLRKWNMVEECKISVVGVVPVVKTCSELSISKRIGILATKRTIESQYLKDLAEKWCPKKDGFEIYYQAANELVKIVESENFDYCSTRMKFEGELNSSRNTRTIIKKYLQPFINAKVDVIALGCTHFPFLRNEIQKIMGESVKILDSNGAVARQVERIVISNKEISSKEDKSSKYRFFTTGDTKTFKVQIKNLIGLKTDNVEKVN
jgi:glutamate racemase